MARDEAEARQVVRALKQRGADFVKVRNMIKRDAYFAIIDEAKKLGLPVAGHIPISITPAEASDAGQKSVEHLLSSILWSCSTAEAEMRRQLGEVWDQPDPGLAFSRLASSQLAPHLSTYSEKKAADLFALFRKNRTWQVPTQVIYQLAASYKDSRHLNDPRLRYIPTDVKERWKRGRMSPTDDYLTTQALYRKNLEAVGALNRAGVPLLAGTDTPVPYIIPGFSLHDELALFVQAGLTPAEALRTATINPAKYFNLEKTLGTVERGKLADLVLLEGNPLEDIRNTQRISAVVVNGRLLDRRALNELLARAEAAASKR